MNWNDISILYQRELRAALRERAILVNSVVIPLLLYPVLLWVTFAAIMFVRGQQESLSSRLVLLEAPQDLVDELIDQDGVIQSEIPEGSSAETAVREGLVDAVLSAEEIDVEGVADLHYELIWDGAEDRSRRARDRIETAIETLRDARIEGELEGRGVSLLDREIYELERRNVATSEEVGAFLLGLLVPLLMVLMIAVGCFYPAVDATAGEHERSTWETSITLAASRPSLLVAKFLYVATMGLMAGLINLIAMTVSMGAVLGPLLAGAGEEMSFSIPLTSLPVVLLTAALLALFIAAGMMLFASFARTFKEGQSMVGPFYLLIILPPMLVQSPDLELTAGWALVPIINVTLLFRSAIQGVFPWGPIALTLLVELVTITLLLWLARRVLDFEDVMAGSYGGSFGRFVKERLLPRRRTA